jgi:transcriptional regulator with XRE-family HTH domain
MFIMSPKIVTRTWSKTTRDAVQVLGLDVARARRERRWTAADLAERAGISPVTLRRVERGDPSVAIGTVFELATLVGVRLFGAEPSELAGLVVRGRERLAVLPARVREPAHEVDDDF